jgi:hypothetical protein
MFKRPDQKQKHAGDYPCPAKYGIKSAEITLPGIDVSECKMDSGGNLTAVVKYDANTFTCCVCFEKIKNDIVCCENSHPLCSICITEIKKAGINTGCPICRSLGRYRPYGLEMIRDKCLDKCGKARSGCKFKGFPGQVKEHSTKCSYTEFKCLFCPKNTDAENMQYHLMTDCKKLFVEMSCKGDYGFLLGDKVGCTIIKSDINPSLVLYAYKNNDECKIIVVDTRTENAKKLVDLSYDTFNCMFEKMELFDTRSVRLPVNTPETLNKGVSYHHVIQLGATAAKKINLLITGFYHKYRINAEYMVFSKCHNWFHGTVTDIDHKKDQIRLKFHISYHGEDGVVEEEWVILENGETTRIRTIPEHNLVLNKEAELRRAYMEMDRM